ncbi:MAG: TspO/MBR family protein [Gloeocapsa sp. UFS-A4-WI-NPMV-4B04]|jgi:tryptophan-rich sensory protein|nr:TspO/MBR family protein [Gloeocapsa sp. UFS-A4-WI-NPMV-4B04]
MIKSWMVIAGVTLLVAFGSFFFKPRDLVWGAYLKRPKWLVFEPAIPIIWTIVFVCGTKSAIRIWDNDPGSPKTWLLMGGYLLLEIATVAYIPATLRLRSLKAGTILGATGLILGVLLTLAVWSISGQAALLLLPYVIWSAIGTNATSEMIEENPDAA